MITCGVDYRFVDFWVHGHAPLRRDGGGSKVALGSGGTGLFGGVDHSGVGSPTGRASRRHAAITAGKGGPAIQSSTLIFFANFFVLSIFREMAFQNEFFSSVRQIPLDRQS